MNRAVFKLLERTCGASRSLSQPSFVVSPTSSSSPLQRILVDVLLLRGYLNIVIEERKNPVKDLLWAIAVSCIILTVVYVLANIVFYTTLTPAVGNTDIPVSVSTENWWFCRCSLSLEAI